MDYIEYMKTQPSRDVDKESEYLALAAQIIYIKSKSMLPVVEMLDEEYGGASEEEQALIEQLKQREFELIKEKTPRLKEMEQFGFYYREPDKDVSAVKIVYTDFNLDNLLKAFASLMLKKESMQREKENVKEIPKDVHTVEEKVTFIKDKLIEKQEVEFNELFSTFSRNEIITTFQAMLEMLKRQFLTVEQLSSFDEIIIKLNPEWDMKDVGNEQFDEYN